MPIIGIAARLILVHVLRHIVNLLFRPTKLRVAQVAAVVDVFSFLQLAPGVALRLSSIPLPYKAIR
jgi:hypothetical protein